MATALIFIQNSQIQERVCIFCDKKTHNLQNCAAVADSSIDEHNKILKKERHLFQMLKYGFFKLKIWSFCKMCIMQTSALPHDVF